MTPLLVAPFFAVIACLTAGAQVKPPATALEGTWREPFHPGEKPADRLVVTVRGDEITVVWYEGVFRGTLPGGSLEEGVITAGAISLLNEKGELQGMTHTCRWLLQSGDLYLQVRAIQNPARDSRFLELAPITFRLEKVKK